MKHKSDLEKNDQGHITGKILKLHKFYDEQTTIEGFTKTKLF